MMEDQPQKPEISVVITCYNNANFVGKAIESVVGQTFADWELLIVDDGSTDDSLARIKAFKDARIKVIAQENQGVIAARNTAITAARGKFFTPLDADDFLEPTFLEKTRLVLLENKEVGFVSSYVRFFDETGELSIWREHQIALKDFLLGTRMVSCSLFRKKCWEEVGGYDAIMEAGYEDWEFYLSILAKGWQGHKIHEPLYNYRQHKTQSRNKAAREKDLALKTIMFNKHKHLYAENLEYIFQEYHLGERRNQRDVEGVKESWSYRIGHGLVKTFRFLSKKI